jgi:hypothetical protein
VLGRRRTNTKWRPVFKGSYIILWTLQLISCPRREARKPEGKKHAGLHAPRDRPSSSYNWGSFAQFTKDRSTLALTLPAESPKHTMSSEYKLPIWPKPPKPSPELKVVLDYFNCLSKWDLETLSQLSTSYFTQVTLPASLHIAARTKQEDIEFLHQFRDSLKGAPLEVCT